VHPSHPVCQSLMCICALGVLQYWTARALLLVCLLHTFCGVPHATQHSEAASGAGTFRLPAERLGVFAPEAHITLCVWPRSPT
jgi:hypothetical protein